MKKIDDFTAIILAAGQGTRLRPYTDDKPKCMVKVKHKSLLEWQIETLLDTGITRIIVVTGYREDKIDIAGIMKVHNDDFKNTNMVYSLMCAQEYLKGDVVIAYGDIIYSKMVLKKILNNENDIVIAADEQWKQYWQKRNEDPLTDAETFLKGKNRTVLSLGDKPKSLNQIESQYIGLTRLSSKGCEKIKSIYKKEFDKPNSTSDAWHSGRNLKNTYMTDLLNYVAETDKLHYEPINRSWLEIDTPNDLKIAHKEIETVL